MDTTASISSEGLPDASNALRTTLISEDPYVLEPHTDAYTQADHSQNKDSVGEFTPDPSQSLPLSPDRQAVLDAVVDLYSGRATEDLLLRLYAPSCVFNDPFTAADGRQEVAAQWLALPKIFGSIENKGVQVTESSPSTLQFKLATEYKVKAIGKKIQATNLVTISLVPVSSPEEAAAEPAQEVPLGVGGEVIKFHKDTWSEKDRQGSFAEHMKKLQSQVTAKVLPMPRSLKQDGRDHGRMIG